MKPLGSSLVVFTSLKFSSLDNYRVPISFDAYIMNRRGEMKMIEKQGLMIYKLWNTLQKSKIVNLAN